MVSVETEALRAVKSSLSNFQTDIEGMSVRANKNAEDIRQECHASVDKLKIEVKFLETQIADLTKRIEALDNSINNTTAEINSISNKILQIKNNIHSLSTQISNLNSQISSLRSQLSNADDEQREQIQEMIDSLEDEVRSCEQRKADLKIQVDNLENEKSGLQQKLHSEKSQKSQCEINLAKAKKRHDRMQNQLDRLITAFNHVASDLQSYVSAAKKFENKSSTNIHSQKSAVESCIESIEAYLLTNIDSSKFSGSSNRERLSNYINSHNDGIDDYATYSQDPEWQGLHNAVYGYSQTNSHELPDSDNHFCGLPIQRLQNGTWGVMSSNQDAYNEYSNNFNDYTYDTFENIEVITIDAREIAGIDMISDNDLNNPQMFWGRSGGTYESFEAIAQMIPEVQNRLTNGESLSMLMQDDRIGACASLFFNTNSADHPTVYVGNGFYELTGGGRHRIMLAQRFGYSIPVRVRGRIVHR